MKWSEQRVWQRWFFEHTSRDEADLKQCLDDIHINSVKHGLVGRAGGWPWSSLRRYVKLSESPLDWGGPAEFHGDEFLSLE